MPDRNARRFPPPWSALPRQTCADKPSQNDPLARLITQKICRQVNPGTMELSVARSCGGRARRTSGQGASDRGEYRQAAGASTEGLITVLFSDWVARCGFVRSTAAEKHELSKIDFELIEDAFTSLLHSRPDPVTADKIVDLRDKFRLRRPGQLFIEAARASRCRPPRELRRAST
jgi:hypothetical protein